MVAGGRVRGRGGVRQSRGAREREGEAGDGSERAGTEDAFMTEDELGVSARGQSLAGGQVAQGQGTGMQP
jgi:hypothetical protein